MKKLRPYTVSPPPGAATERWQKNQYGLILAIWILHLGIIALLLMACSCLDDLAASNRAILNANQPVVPSGIVIRPMVPGGAGNGTQETPRQRALRHLRGGSTDT